MHTWEGIRIRNRFSDAAGFTLIELMIVVVIVGVLGAIALPSYNAHVLRGKRAEGRNALMDVGARQQRFYSDNNQYAAALGDVYTDPAACGGTAGFQSETCKYTLTVTVGTDNQSFALKAEPSFTDAECGDLTLNSAGQKGSGGDPANCWGR